MSIKIRRALPGEAEILSKIAFSAKAHWGYSEHWMEIWKSQLDFRPEYFEKNESWAVDMNGNPIAFYTLQEKDDIAWLENLWVLPEYIGRGIGKQLFLHALARSRELGFSRLGLDADPNAAGFYAKMGMTKIDEHDYPIEGEPRFLPVMEITL